MPRTAKWPETHEVPMRPETWRGFEPMEVQEAAEPCHHRVACEEDQDEEAFRKLRRMEPGEAVRTDLNNRQGPGNELRAGRLFELRGDFEAVTQGVDRETWRGERVRLRKDVMPTQAGRGLRSCARKTEAASLYKTSKPNRARECDEQELRKALASIGE